MPTHGSLTKAGKVRNQTPKIAAQSRKKRNPKARTRRNYSKRVLNQREETGSRSRRRRRR